MMNHYVTVSLFFLLLTVGCNSSSQENATRAEQVELSEQEEKFYSPYRMPIAISPDGRYATLYRMEDKEKNIEDSIQVIEIAENKTSEFATHDMIRKVRFSPDAKHVIASGFENVVLWDWKEGKPFKTYVSVSHSNTVDMSGFSFVVSPDHKQILTLSVSSTPSVWEVETGKETLLKEVFKSKKIGTINTAAFSQDGTKVFFAARTYTDEENPIRKNVILGFDMSAEAFLETSHPFTVTDMCPTPDEKLVLVSRTGEGDPIFLTAENWRYHLRVINSETGKEEQIIPGDAKEKWYWRRVWLSTDGKYAAADTGNKIELWNIADGTKISEHPYSKETRPQECSFLTDGSLVAVSFDKDDKPVFTRIQNASK